LQAVLHHVPGVRGHCKGYLHLVEGKVVASYLEDKEARRFPVGKEALCRLDNEKGPFEWSFYPLPAPPTPKATLRSGPLPYMEQRSPTPRRVASLDVNQLEGWSMKQRLMVTIVFETIDGQHTIEEIKANVPLLYEVTDEALRILLALKVIVLLP
jgi:hypothetical protein